MSQCCDKMKLGSVASFKQSKTKLHLDSKSGNPFDNNEYNLYREGFLMAIKTRGLHDTIVLNALENSANFMAIFQFERWLQFSTWNYS